MTPFERHLSAATGYLELGLPLDAEEELDEIDAELRTDWRVLALRVNIYGELGRWERMREAARHLTIIQPDRPEWVVSLAYATRRAESIEAAEGVLLAAKVRFPEDAAIRYNLACYTAQMGKLPAARNYLREAFRLNPAFRKMAPEDEDLESLWGELREGRL
jgi:Flp pilus assembly protein TadD